MSAVVFEVRHGAYNNVMIMPLVVIHAYDIIDQEMLLFFVRYSGFHVKMHQRVYAG